MFQIVDVPRNQSSYSQMIFGVLHSLRKRIGHLGSMETNVSVIFWESKRITYQRRCPQRVLFQVSLAFAIRFHDFLEEAEE